MVRIGVTELRCALTLGLLRSLEAVRLREEPWTWKQGARGA